VQLPALQAATTNEDKSLTVMQYLGERATRMSSKLPATPDNLKDWTKRRKVVQKQLAARLGLPERVPMRAKITRTQESDDLIVEDVIYLWADNAYVAANVVRPKTITGALPGLVVPPGWLGDLQQEYYKPFVYHMARKGYVVLFIDDPHVRQRVAPYEGLYCAAAAAGTQCMGIQVFDTLRGFDYMLTRSDVDPNRIGIAGLCQGSEQTWLTAALEERFKIAVPVCGTTTYEQWVRMPAFLSVNLSDPSPYVANVLYDTDWDEIDACIAPRPVYVASNSGDNWWPKAGYQKVVSTMEKVYQLYRKPENFKNLFVLRSHSMTPFIAELAPWIDQHLKELPVTAKFTPAPCAEPENPSLSMLKYAQQRIIRQTEFLPKTFSSKRAWSRYNEQVAAWLKKTCDIDSIKSGKAKGVSREVKDGMVFEVIFLPQDKDFGVPVLLVYQDKADAGKRPAVVFSCDGGQSMLDDDVVKFSAGLASDGYVVCVPDHANVNPRSRRSISNLCSFYGCSDSVGLPPVAMRVWDNMTIVGYLGQRAGIDVNRIALIGLGYGVVDAAITAAVEPKISALGVAGAITVRDWADKVAPSENEFSYWAPYLNGITLLTDLQYVYSSIAPRPLLLVDSTARNLWPESGYQRVEEMADQIFKLNGKPDALTKRPARSAWGIEEIRPWLGIVLKNDKLAQTATIPAVETTAAVKWSQYDVTSPSDILGGPAGVLPGSARAVDSTATLNGIEYSLLPASTLSLNSGGFPQGDIGNLSDVGLNRLLRASGYGAGPLNYTIAGAKPGQRYRAQFFVFNQSWGTNSTITVTLEGADSPPWEVATKSKTPDTGRLMQAEWIQAAGDTNIDFKLTKSPGGEGVQLSGFVVHALGAPGSEASVRPEKPSAQMLLDQRNARMKWWREAKFGMFIHWGLYSVTAGEWNGQSNYGEWIMCHCKIPVKEYAGLAAKFNPVKFDAKAWVSMAKDAGMKYIVITAKHHDGFAMFRSQADPFNIYDATPFKRDPLKELAAECQKQGIKLGFYYSQTQDWHQPGGDAVLGRWDSAQNGDFGIYLNKVVLPHLKELMTNYGPVAVLWWDTPTGSMTAERTDLMKAMLKLQPAIITNNRLGGKNPGDTETPEQEIPASGIPGKDWETCMTMGTHWGYNKTDVNLKSSSELIRMLIDIVSKGGNYLLNVGPTGEGLFPEHNVQRLADIGKWMKVNGEAIYGTTPGPFQKAPAWGRVTQKPFDAAQGRPGKLYLHVFDWPKDGKLAVLGLTAKVQKAYLLSDAKHAALTTTVNAGGVEVTVPAQAPDAVASVVVLELESKP